MTCAAGGFCVSPKLMHSAYAGKCHSCVRNVTVKFLSGFILCYEPRKKFQNAPAQCCRRMRVGGRCCAFEPILHDLLTSE